MSNDAVVKKVQKEKSLKEIVVDSIATGAIAYPIAVIGYMATKDLTFSEALTNEYVVTLPLGVAVGRAVVEGVRKAYSSYKNK